MKKILLLLSLFLSVVSFAQIENKYKYVIVPAKFDFQKEPNQYNLNEITKMIFRNQGFEVYYDTEEFPLELSQNGCDALYVNVLKGGNLFLTKIQYVLKDCTNKEVLSSVEGVSREKTYSKAYIEAFRIAGKSIANINSKLLRDSNEVINNKVVSNSIAKDANEGPSYKEGTVLLFAQPNSNGYQLVDTTPKVVMKLYKTSAANFYIGQKETVQGVVFNKNSQWFFEYYQNENLVTEKLEIKF
ncbi:hypothetical protein [Flavobacterium sp.]|uniref:hypothetical protein n=1 Tax=Flavobacterium sp. TaxID=239 RepID=UPI0028BE0816|nr:hypothetical protein [Flavobacterium sp.]